MYSRRLKPHQQSSAAGTSVVRMIADLGVLIGVVTALLYYYGWVMLSAEVKTMGFEVSILRLGNTEYLVKSVMVVFASAVPVLLIALVALSLQRKVLAPLIAGAELRAALRIARMCSWAWAPLALLAGLLMLTPFDGYALPLSLLAASLIAQYGRGIIRKRTGHEPWSNSTRIVVAVLLGLGVFWTVDRVARTIGESAALLLAADPGELPAIALYSDENLYLDGPGVVSVATGRGFCYSGLFLFKQSDNSYFFITKQPGRVIILNASATVWMDSSRSRSSDVKPCSSAHSP